jgi:hypothetical protein
VLSIHNQSSPALRLLKGDSLNTTLDSATKEYLDQYVQASYTRKEVRSRALSL